MIDGFCDARRDYYIRDVLLAEIPLNSRSMEPAGHDCGNSCPALGGFLNRSLDQNPVTLQSGFVEALHTRQIPIENLQLGRQSVGEVVLFDERFEKIRKSRRLEFILVCVIELGILLRQGEFEHLLINIVYPYHTIKLGLLRGGKKAPLHGFFKPVDLVKDRDIHRIIEPHVAYIGKDIGVLLFQGRFIRLTPESALDLILKIPVILGTLHFVHTEMDSVREETGQLLAGDQFFEILDQQVDLFFGLVKIDLLLEIHQLEKRAHVRIIIQRDPVLVGQLDEATDIADHLAAAFLEVRTAAVKVADLLGKHKAAYPGQKLGKLGKNLFILRLEAERINISGPVLFIKFGIFDAI
ncbi:MAG: hypothetical protein BWY42_00853 [Candidatus Omnitrophica bacterium ADurb.Bin277]|nr:MAG: hypothetical protein BWY42_00853 [Candidatus Omnitrophica bacterium ADurb.Bin277]